MEKHSNTKKEERPEAGRRKRPSWVKKSVLAEEALCPDCFKVVGTKSRYKLVCMLGKSSAGLTVSELTKRLDLRQPTVTTISMFCVRSTRLRARERGASTFTNSTAARIASKSAKSPTANPSKLLHLLL